MKHLNLFNENNDYEDFRIDIKEYCNSHLAYLIDNDFKVFCLMMTKGVYRLVISKAVVRVDAYGESRNEFMPFNWDSIKDQFIPFLHQFNNDFNITDIQFTLGKQVMRNNILNPTIEEALDDNLKGLITYDRVRKLSITKIIIFIEK